jgi:putative PIN family toxin of toxin-antitoxin system
MYPFHKPANSSSNQSAPPPLLVLDTNVVLDWVAFCDSRVRPVADAIERGLLQAATSSACLQELRRALGYAQVKLDTRAQQLAYERYTAFARVYPVPESSATAGMPRCEDPNDQKFLELAWHARASHLLTRDKALLKLARPLARLGRFCVMAPQEFLPQTR